MQTSSDVATSSNRGEISRVISAGTVRAPLFYEGPTDVRGDVRLHFRYFTYRTAMGLAAGCDMSIMFTIERPAKEVWPYVKDFNLWQNAYQHYYSGVLGDLEGKSFALGMNPNDLGPHRHEVLRVVPEYLLVVSQPVPKDGTPSGLPGVDGISPGFHVVMLNEHSGNTVVTVFMEHASYASRTQDMTDEEALGPWRRPEMASEWHRKWRDDFIPTLKKLVYEGK
jgi:hypothetical protein